MSLQSRFLKPETTKEEWNKSIFKTDDDIKAAAIEYLAFAYEKCEDERGLSANRSIDHYEGFFWLLGDAEYGAFVATEYGWYGRTQLDKASELLGVPPKKAP
jgi:hypothetical protein